ncbi:DUF2624 domain-containing protein [Neobacillus sp. LXY-4]|uniref:DUF2624 domain-containing protein n=1 Tax=Neobacillus sp. LXY-4 TaxID=3379826 RepID=UPI003EE35508
MQVSIFENIINYKLKTITSDELLKYANPFNISLSKNQAEKIAQYLRSTRLNIFQDSERAQMIKDIAKITGPETAREINKLFITFTK